MEEIFHPPNLILSADVIPNYQLIRGVLAANATGGSFDRFAFSVMQGGWNCRSSPMNPAWLSRCVASRRPRAKSE